MIIMIKWSREITTKMIMKFRMFSIYSWFDESDKGIDEERIFTLYIFRKNRWKIKLIFIEWFFLFIIKWCTNIMCVLWMIGSRFIRGYINTSTIKDKRITNNIGKKKRRHGQKDVMLHCRFMLICLLILLVNDNVGWLWKINSVNGLIVVQKSYRV